MKNKKCPWCNSIDSKKIGLRKDKISLLKCHICGLIFVSEFPDKLEEYYGSDYFTPNEKIDIGYSEKYDLISPLFFYWQKALIEIAINSNVKSSFLEIGCATGNSLEIIKNEIKNISTVKGIDISEFAISLAKLKKLDVECADIENYNGSEKVDIIFSAETMEHVANLKSYLDGVKRNLKNDGVFIYYVPSIKEDYIISLQEKYTPLASSLEHTLYFTKEFLKKEFNSFFACDARAYEFEFGYNNSIIGYITKDKNRDTRMHKILEMVCSNDVNAISTLDKSDLEDAVLISAKFSRHFLADSIMTKIKDIITIREADFLNSFIKYYKGELYEARRLLLKSFKNNALLSNFQSEVLYSIEQELLKYNENLLKEKQKNPIFSVIVPSYNHGKYIRGAIESVINQTFEDWELIVIDDGSLDNSVEIIKQYKDSRIRLFTQENHDAPYTINRGMKKARGKYIAILNSDDIFELTKLQDSLDVLSQGYDFVFGKLSVIDEFNKKMDSRDERVIWIEKRLNNFKKNYGINNLLLNINYLVTTSNFVFNRRIVDEIGFFHEKLHISHDFNYLLKIFSGNYKIKLIPKFQVKYRIHADNTLLKGKSESFLEACYSISLMLRNKEFDAKRITLDFYCIPFVPNILFYYSLLSEKEIEGVISEKKNKHRINLLFIIDRLLADNGYWSGPIAGDLYEKYDLEILKKMLQVRDHQIWKASSDLYDIRSSLRWKIPNFIYKKIKKLQALFK